jgi:hypothetical protein
MKAENNSSGPISGTTSTSEPRRPADNRIDESKFLSEQAEEAKAAMAQAAGEMKDWLLKGASPINWARQHPWIGMGIGAVAGFVAAAAVVPSKEQQALNRLARIEAALNPSRRPPEENGKERGNGREKGHSLLKTILRELMTALGPLLGSVLSNSAAPPPEPGPQTGGDPKPINRPPET